MQIKCELSICMSYLNRKSVTEKELEEKDLHTTCMLKI